MEPQVPASKSISACWAAEPTTDFGGLQTLRPQPGMPGCLMQFGSVVSLDHIAQIGPKDADALRSHT